MLEKLKEDELEAKNLELAKEGKSVKVDSIETSVGLAATKLARDIDSDCIISIENSKGEGYEDSNFLNVKVVIFRRLNKNVYNKIEYETKVHKVSPGSIIPVKEVLMEAVNKKYLGKGDKVVCLEDESMGTGYKALLFVFDVDKIFFNISTHKLAENIDPNVLETVINIALEVSREGREGNNIGTAFVIGDRNNVLRHTRQLIINPFNGYEEEKRNITDPSIKETIKEFSQLDGVFVIDEKGTILTAGAYLDVDTSEIKLTGFGTRHMNCAAITKVTNAIAIVVSKSGGVVRVIKDGNIVMRLP